MSNFTKETYDEGLSAIKSGKVFHFGGRSAVTVDDLDFIAKVEGLEASVPKIAAKTDEEKPKAGAGKKAAEKKAEEHPAAPVAPPAAPDGVEAKKKEAEELVQAKLEALNAAKTDEEKAKATLEYEEAQKALLDLG